MKNHILLVVGILSYARGESRCVAILLLTILTSYPEGLLVSQLRYKRTTLPVTRPTENFYEMIYYVDRVDAATLIAGIIGAASVSSGMMEMQNCSRVCIALVNT